MCVAICGRVDDDLNAFTRVHGLGSGLPASLFAKPAAILRADIDGGFGWHFAHRDLLKFTGVIAREKDVVVAEVETAGFGMGEPHHRR